MRLLYLDEAGTDSKSPAMCVAGVLVHGDKEWPEIDRRVEALIEKYIPENDRLGFVFHATDIYHGSGYFDRCKPEWSDRAKRELVLTDLANIIDEMKLPVVCGNYEKDKFGIGILNAEDGPKLKGNLLHNVAALDCLIWADRWLAKWAPSELATVVHEDGVPAKQLIKHSVLVLRSDAQLDAAGLTKTKNEFGLPLKRIIDTVHFADKPAARPLQLADLCAFVIGRLLKNLPVPPGLTKTIIGLLAMSRGKMDVLLKNLDRPSAEPNS